MYRILDDTEAVEATDYYSYNGVLRAVPRDWVHQIFHNKFGVILRPIPEPTWRKISDGPVTYPCLVSNGKEVAEGWECDGVLVGRNKSPNWDAGIILWFPTKYPPLPAPEKSAEELAFDKWIAEHWPIRNQAETFINFVDRARRAYLAAKGQQ